MRWPRSAWRRLRALFGRNYEMRLSPCELAALWQVVVSCPNERKGRLWKESPHLERSFRSAYAKLERALDAEADSRRGGTG